MASLRNNQKEEAMELDKLAELNGRAGNYN
jgi:hypothetical protein